MQFHDLKGNQIETPPGARVPPEGPVSEGMSPRQCKVEQDTDEFGNDFIRISFTAWGKGEGGAKATDEELAYYLHCAQEAIKGMADEAAAKIA